MTCDFRVDTLIETMNDPNEDPEIREACALELMNLGLYEVL